MADGLPGGSAQGRHRPESPARQSGDAIQDDDAAPVRAGVGRMGRGQRVSESAAECSTRETADVQNTNNISGFKDKRIDEICEQYDLEFDPAKRAALLRELDGILTNQHHYIMEWYPPSHRFAYWNKFGMPTGTLSRMGDDDRLTCPGHSAALVDRSAESAASSNRRMRDKSMKLEVPPVEDRYWQEYPTKERDAQHRRRRDDRVFPPAASADHPDVHRDHAGRVRDHAFRAGRPGRAADHALPDGACRRRRRWRQRPRRHRDPAGGHRGDSAVLRVRQAGAHPLRVLAVESRRTSISEIRTSTRIRSGTSSSPAFRCRLPSA